MAIVLFRIDERLIHGQVVVGWGAQLRPDRYLVVDRTLMESEWEQELYTLGVPERVDIGFFGPGEARSELPGWQEAELKSVLLTRDLATMLELAKGGLMAGEKVNLGGLHFRSGREEVLPYLFLDDSDRELLARLADEGVEISAQALPGSPRVSLGSLLA
jgi:PTS system mannose-specific IIB component/fructoselysine and glucoselysine-specific PTS system IIB component